MMPVLVVPVMEAAFFTLGCIAIHALRRRADVVTATLACFATLLVLMIGIAYAPEPLAHYQSMSTGDVIVADPAVY